MNRQCGPCSLCCTTLGVPSINKEPRVRCQHLRQGCCGVYTDRPPECREFECLWLKGLMPNDLRPDKVKAFVNTTIEGDILVVNILPVHRGAHKKGALRLWIDHVSKKGVSVIVTCGDDRILYGPVSRDLEVMIQSFDSLDGPPQLTQITTRKGEKP